MLVSCLWCLWYGFVAVACACFCIFRFLQPFCWWGLKMHISDLFCSKRSWAELFRELRTTSVCFFSLTARLRFISLLVTDQHFLWGFDKQRNSTVINFRWIVQSVSSLRYSKIQPLDLVWNLYCRSILPELTGQTCSRWLVPVLSQETFQFHYPKPYLFSSFLQSLEQPFFCQGRQGTLSKIQGSTVLMWSIYDACRHVDSRYSILGDSCPSLSLPLVVLLMRTRSLDASCPEFHSSFHSFTRLFPFGMVWPVTPALVSTILLYPPTSVWTRVSLARSPWTSSPWTWAAKKSSVGMSSDQILSRSSTPPRAICNLWWMVFFIPLLVTSRASVSARSSTSAWLCPHQYAHLANTSVRATYC
jgi:hypothetical protein